MNEYLSNEAVIQSAAFLELSGGDIVDPDAAVRELEAKSDAANVEYGGAPSIC